MPAPRQMRFLLAVLACVLTTMIAYIVVTYSDDNSTLPLPWLREGPKPHVFVAAPPSEGSHWTLVQAYEADQVEHRFHTGSDHTRITTEGPANEVSLGDSDSFEFTWHDSGEALSLHDFVLKEDRSVTLTYLKFKKVEHEGKEATGWDRLRVGFKLSPAEVKGPRDLLIAADLGHAPKLYTREGWFDGAQWQMELIAKGQTASVRFSNAYPDEFRAIVIYILRDLCAPRADLIDKAVLVSE